MKIIENKIVSIVQYYCDICGHEIALPHDVPQECNICGRTMCHFCSNFLGDRLICNICKDMAPEFVDAMAKWTIAYAEWKKIAINEIYRKWAMKSKATVSVGDLPRDVTRYRPSSDRGTKSTCDMCGIDLMLTDSKYAYEIKHGHGRIHVCEKCYDEREHRHRELFEVTCQKRLMINVDRMER